MFRMKRKIQIFISSTYIDLKEERQAAVEAILDSGHIPAGMELFKAGNESQLKTIKRWINESDAFLLILGGRFGSLEKDIGKSYTQLEYEYAVEKEIPIFSIVLTDSALHKKAAEEQIPVFEEINKEKFNTFKELIHTKVVKPADDIKDIKLAIHSTLKEFEELYDFEGWVKGIDLDELDSLRKENHSLLKENQKLKKQIEKQTNKKVGDFDYSELKNLLSKKEITIPAELFDNEDELKVDYLNLFSATHEQRFSIGVENRYGMKDPDRFLFFDFAPYLLNFGLLEKIKVTGAKYQRIQTSKNGMKFLAMYEMDKEHG